jgi:hypothetical protein
MKLSLACSVEEFYLLGYTRRFGEAYRLHLQALLVTCFYAGFLLDLFFEPVER